MKRRIVGALASLFLIAACATTPPAPATPAAAAMPSFAGPVSEDVQLSTASGVLHGTLLAPVRSRTIPVALIVAGSGPTDRNGNSPLLAGENNSLRLLAETLAANGIASLRYDKRGIGASAAAGPAESELRFDHYVADAADWVRHLRRDPRYSSVTIIGHSEGSLIGMAAARQAGADAFLSIAGAGRGAPVVLREQLKPQLPPELWQESERILTRLLAGQTVEPVPPSLAMLYRPSVQPYLISWFAYDPATEIARLDVPVLIVQGTTDIQATAADAEALHRASPKSELAMIEGMNHVLKSVDADRSRQVASYSDPSLPLTAELGQRIAAFMNRL